MSLERNEREPMSMKKRGSFIMLLEHVHTMDELTDEEFGKFVRAYASYIETGVEPNFDDRSMRLMWKTVKAFDDMNCEKYESTSAARREAGKRGAMKRWAQEGKGIASDSKNSKCHFANFHRLARTGTDNRHPRSSTGPAEPQCCTRIPQHRRSEGIRPAGTGRGRYFAPI